MLLLGGFAYSSDGTSRAEQDFNNFSWADEPWLPDDYLQGNAYSRAFSPNASEESLRTKQGVRPAKKWLSPKKLATIQAFQQAMVEAAEQYARYAGCEPSMRGFSPQVDIQSACGHVDKR